MGKVKEAKKYLKEHFDDVNAEAQNKLRAKFLHRWARLSGSANPNDPETIDWTNKYVRMESLLCDTGIWIRLSDKKT